MRNKKQRPNLLKDPVSPTILKMAGGMIIGFLAMSAFNAIDTFFVGRLGATPLAAMSFTFPVVMVLNSIALGLGVGLSSNVSRAIGAGDKHKVQRLTTDGLILSVLIVLVIAVGGLLTIDPLFTMLGARGETLELIRKYMTVWYIGVAFVIIPMAGNNVIRATGDTLTPSIIMTSSVIVNTILDPLMIFGIGPFPRMGIAGAALATVIARFTTMLLSLYVLGFREKLITAERPQWVEVAANWKSILFIGGPAALVQAINPLSLGIITHLIAGYGEKVVAGFGAAGRVEMILALVPMALATSMAPFAGQNYGAKNLSRIKSAVRFSSMISIGWGVLVFGFCLLLAAPVISLFNSDPRIIHAGASYLKIVSISYGFLGIMMLVSQSFNAMNRPLHSAGLTLVKAFVLNIPLAYLGSGIWSENGIFSSTLVANIFSGVLGLVLLFYFLSKGEEALLAAA